MFSGRKVPGMGDARGGSSGATRVPVMSPARRIPPNFFGFGFGLAGLGETWRIAEHYGRAPASVAKSIDDNAAVTAGATAGFSGHICCFTSES